MGMLKLTQISKSYGETLALHPVDLTVDDGCTVALLGPSGCGKSTLLRTIVGLIKPDHGSVELDGLELNDQNVLDARRKMGYVIQDGGLFPHLTAERNVTIVARFLRWSEDRIANRLEELRDLTHFPADGLSRFPLQLSGGQRQRVSLMRALMLDPDLLLLDEPLGALDPMIRAELQADLRAIFRTLRKTVVMVTHDLAEASFLADQIVLMRNGQVVQRGQFSDLVKSPADPYVTRFINAQRSPLDALSTEEP